ncbi:DUF6415 family natural product biosynthesis protein [Streptomyces niveus]|uniref:DUF6415 family natural product biosynthesis protein n=1 Tax=Streptomyces niveus TaxID=193462 RepID=UPI0036A8ED26
MSNHLSYTTEDGALGPAWDAEPVGRADAGRLTRLMTLLEAASAPADVLPARGTMKETVALVLDGRHAPATEEELATLVALMRRYLDQLVRSAEAPGSGPQLVALAEKGRLLLRDRRPGNGRQDVVRVAGVVRDLLDAVEGGGS